MNSQPTKQNTCPSACSEPVELSSFLADAPMEIGTFAF